MATRTVGGAAQEIDDLFTWGTMVGVPDDELVARFVSGQAQSEAAFRALIHRHGPMVLGICRRILDNEHAAEDAFQATFLVLLKKARALRHRGLLTNWLYGVALRVSKQERTRCLRHRAAELSAAEQVSEAASDCDRVDLRSVIDEEIARLPEHYRQALLLCHVEGLRHEDAALKLGCPVGTIESRLSRARGLLRDRLTRRGLAPSEVATSALLVPGSPLWMLQPRPAVVEATVAAALELEFRPDGARAVLTWLSAGISNSAFLTRPATLTLSVACCALFVAGLAYRYWLIDSSPKPASADPAPPEAPASRPAPGATTNRIIAESDPRRTAHKVTSVPAASRSPSAYAVSLAGIKIDGRLDDWPANLPHYPIRRQLLDFTDYESRPVETSEQTDAYFMPGFSEEEQAVYLAVVVRDDQVKVHADIRRGAGEHISDTVYATDAVEIYMSGSLSNRAIREPKGGVSLLNAATMPVLQYVGVPASVGAYGDAEGANPALMYRKSAEPYARMAYRRDGDLIRYEWSLPVYDLFPGVLARVKAGMRLGLDVAVVDKDSDQKPPVFTTWGSPPSRFKGLDAGSLGELILGEAP
jgi:RNA polymerase sigma factor (sigma-70 family)